MSRIARASSPGINSNDEALAAKNFRTLTDEIGPLDSSGVERHFVGPGAQYRSYVFRRVEAAPDGQRYKNLVCHTPHQIHNYGPLVRRCGDVQKRQLVRAFLVIAARLLDRVTCVSERDKTYALDHATAINIKTWDDAFRQH